MNVIDFSGRQATATVLQGPMVLNTPEGEFCADAGHIVVQYEMQKPIVLTQPLFDAQFVEIPA